jgi:hypothetical protein
MSVDRDFVERRGNSSYLVGSRVPLAAIVREFQDGHSPEAIRSALPTLRLEQVYGVVGIGASLGLAAAYTTAEGMRGLLFGITPWNPLSQAITIALLAIVALTAAWIPARRAIRVDPATVLRTE